MHFSRIKTLLHTKVTLFLCCCCVALASCDDPNELGLGLVDDTIAGRYTDTLTVNLSTVYLDSMVSSGTGTMLTGQYSSPSSGILKASTFFQVGLNSATWTVADGAVFDSLRLILPYSGYSYGDTTQAVSYDIYRLTGTITARTLSPYLFNEEPLSVFYADDALYNVSNTATAPEILTSFALLPRPQTKDTLSISLPGELGQEWLALKKAGDTRLTDPTEFQSYFRGLKITSSAGSAVLGFPVASTKVRLYYTETVDGTSTAKTKDFPLINSALQYNQFLTNFDGAQLAGVVRGGTPVPASQTSDISVAQGGAGLMVKLEIPYLASLKGQVPPNLINRAVLVVEPLNNTIQYPFTVPASLGLYTTNNSNVPLAQVMADGSNALTSTYTEPNQQSTTGQYVFNLTPEIVQMLRLENTGSLTMLLAPPPSSFTTGVSRLVLGAGANPQQSVKLKIYYTTIK